MQKIVLTACLVFFSAITYGQRYYPKDIITKADSIMKITVGDRIFNKYYHYSTDCYYQYKNARGKTHWKALTLTKRTKKIFNGMYVNYLFCLDTFNIACLTSSVHFDGNLKRTDSIQVDFIPAYVWEGKKCNFITDSMALTIAKQTFTRPGIKPIKMGLEYDYKKKAYSWNVTNTITENTDGLGRKYGDMQLCTIDAMSGKVIDFTNALFTPPSY